MTQDEIIRMMKESGFYFNKTDAFMPEWVRFTDLVRKQTLCEAAAIVLMSPSREAAVDVLQEMGK